MIAPATTRMTKLALSDDDERSLLVRLELLLEREEEMIVARDAAGLVAVAEERERVTAQLGDAARARRLASGTPGDEAELVDLYARLRQRHHARARLIQRHAERNARAVSVMAQATGNAQNNQLYDAGGRVPLQFVSL